VGTEPEKRKKTSIKGSSKKHSRAKTNTHNKESKPRNKHTARQHHR
jgi:hypothetical protein